MELDLWWSSTRSAVVDLAISADFGPSHEHGGPVPSLGDLLDRSTGARPFAVLRELGAIARGERPGMALDLEPARFCASCGELYEELDDRPGCRHCGDHVITTAHRFPPVFDCPPPPTRLGAWSRVAAAVDESPF